MKKAFFVFFLGLLLIPFAVAEIKLHTDQPVYNIGNRIKAYGSVSHVDSFEGLFKLYIECGQYSLEYFRTPLPLESGFTTALTIPEIPAADNMLGSCNLKGELVTNENDIIQQGISEKFEITGTLKIFPINPEITSFPGEKIQMTAVVNEASGHNLIKGFGTISLDNESFEANIHDGSLKHYIQLSPTIESGNHVINIIASDEAGNKGNSSITLNIIAVPKHLQLIVSPESVDPGQYVNITATIYDQADDPINISLEVSLTNPKKNSLFKKPAKSTETFTYEFSQYSIPGRYEFVANYKDLNAVFGINLSTILDVQVRYRNESITIENIGNVPFEDEIIFILENELKQYHITKKIFAEPGKLVAIDLSREVPFGIYNVIAPLKQGLSTLDDVLDEIRSSGNQSILVSNAEIHDNRPAYKKLASNIDSISGTLTGADGLLTKHPLITPTILVVILVAIIFHYGRKPILNILRRDKNKEELENKPNSSIKK